MLRLMVQKFDDNTISGSKNKNLKQIFPTIFDILENNCAGLLKKGRYLVFLTQNWCEMTTRIEKLFLENKSLPAKPCKGVNIAILFLLMVT